MPSAWAGRCMKRSMNGEFSPAKEIEFHRVSPDTGNQHKKCRDGYKSRIVRQRATLAEMDINSEVVWLRYHEFQNINRTLIVSFSSLVFYSDRVCFLSISLQIKSNKFQRFFRLYRACTVGPFRRLGPKHDLQTCLGLSRRVRFHPLVKLATNSSVAIQSIASFLICYNFPVFAFFNFVPINVFWFFNWPWVLRGDKMEDGE
jgi:hypothetical protein